MASSIRLGLLAAVSVLSKLMLLEMMTALGHTERDEPLTITYFQPWTKWVEHLPKLEQCSIPLIYSGISFAKAFNKDFHIFFDASKETIGTVAHIRLFDVDNVTVSFHLGKGTSAPVHGNMISLLELCAAVLATEVTEMGKDNFGINSCNIYFYIESKWSMDLNYEHESYPSVDVDMDKEIRLEFR